MKKLLSILLLISSLAQAQTGTKIPLKESDAYQQNHISVRVTKLIDDDSTTEYGLTASNGIFKPHVVVFDLSDYDPVTVKSIVYYDGNGVGQVPSKFYLVRKSDGYRYNFFNFTGPVFNVRSVYNIPTDSQFVASKLIIEIQQGQAILPKYIQLWGDWTPHTDPVWTRHNVPLKNMLMANAHLWDLDTTYPAKVTALKNMKMHGVRVYADVNRLKDSATGAFTFTAFNWEKGIKQLKQNNPDFFTQVAYQQQSLPARASYKAHGLTNAWYKYYGTDSTQASAWDSAAYDHYVLALRGGTKSTGSNYLTIGSTTMQKGTNWFQATEIGNEWDNWYSTPAVQYYMTPEGQAMATSAAYDGHKGALGSNRGVKNADTNVLFTNAGIAWDWPDYFRQMVEYYKTIRGYKPNGQVDIPLDYWSFHIYSSAGGQYSGSTTGGLPPEQGMTPSLQRMVYFRNKYGGGLPLAAGEWGWDVHPNSILNAPAFGSYTAEQTRAMWAARGILVFLQEDIDYAQWFRLYENYYAGQGGYAISDANSTQFETMALLRQSDDAATTVNRTLAGDYFAQIAELGDYRFDSTIRNDSLHVIRLKKDTSYCYAIWTEERTTIVSNKPSFTERTIAYNAPAGTIKLFNDVGQASTLTSTPFIGGNITATSTPVFILTSSPSQPEPPSEPASQRFIRSKPKGQKVIFKTE